jgi:hypothetical protein
MSLLGMRAAAERTGRIRDAASRAHAHASRGVKPKRPPRACLKRRGFVDGRRASTSKYSQALDERRQVEAEMQRFVTIAGAAVFFCQAPLVKKAALHVRAGLKEH